MLRKAFRDLKNNDPLRMAAATAFFTTFALPAILIILIQLFGLVVGRRTMSRHLFDHLEQIVGDGGVLQIRSTLRAFRNFSQSWYITLGGFIFLVFVATTLFKIIRDSLNQLWNIKVHDHSGVVFTIRQRLRSIGIIFLAGLLFMASLLIEAMQTILMDYINEIWSGSTSLLYAILNQLLSVLVVTIWFATVFRYLANGRPVWRVAIVGGLVTGILFTIGKLLIGWLLGFGNLNSFFGASASFVLILLFVFYSSFILYFGGTFTSAWGDYVNKPIAPGTHAYKYVLTEIKTEESPAQK
ncbi:MAG: YihY/virulence factor BrkB family protein [Chitinophagaceae bacterium]